VAYLLQKKLPHDNWYQSSVGVMVAGSTQNLRERLAKLEALLCVLAKESSSFTLAE
jgi:hypothetical protein